MFDVIAMVFISTISILFLIVALHQRKGRLELLDKYLKSEIEKSIVLDKLAETLKELEAKKIEESDGFLKFVSDSREWAFKYIEDVQGALKEFDSAISADLKYAETYGKLDMDGPSKEILSRVGKAYKKLREVLPEDMIN